MPKRPRDLAHPAPVLVGILAGGRAQRMGGIDKGALPAPDTGEPLLHRLLRLCAELALEAVVIGGPPVADARVLTDDPPGIGPLGGLATLLTHAGPRPAILLACDMPHLQPELLARLAHTPSPAPILAPRDPTTSKWQPFFARYDAPVVLPHLRIALGANIRSFQRLFQRVEVAELPLTPPEHAQLRDWDEPADLLR